MDNLEAVLQCLNDFERAKEKNIVPALDHLLSHIAKTGRTEFPWHLLKPLIAYKLERVLSDFFENNSSPANAYISEPTSKSKGVYPDVQKLITLLNCFTGTPFTIQRICELITEPNKYYKTMDKFLRGVEKNIMVVSTIQPDGSLITRSTANVLTNGDLSPNKLKTIPTTPNITLVNNSPLNTNTQDSTVPSSTVPSSTVPSSTVPSSTVPSSTATTDGKPKPNENSLDSNADTNLMQNNKNEIEESGKTEDAQRLEYDKTGSTNTNENSVSTAQRDNAVSCVENRTNEQKVEETGNVALENHEIPTDEKAATSEDERMEES